MYKLLKPKKQTIKGDELHDYDHKFNFADDELISKKNGETKKMSSYVIGEDLVNAINAALVTGRPLLLKGDPGCGKTKVALAIAKFFHGKNAYKHYFEWHVKSKSKAKDGGYTYDHVRRLRDATMKDEATKAKVQNSHEYIEMGPMGMAFKSDTKNDEKPSILLIDEIDKGDIDFPNDLLLELDEMRFKIDELDKFVSADRSKKPLVFITSNDERDLPPAFLRRCLYYYIPAHDNDLLMLIANFKNAELAKDLNLKDNQILGVDKLQLLITEFIKERDQVNHTKKPSTSEMIDWLKLIIFNSKNSGLSDEAFDKLLKKEALKAITLIKES
jgi:MoxR-like ATPase